MDYWCRGLSRLPVTEKITSSNLVWSAIADLAQLGEHRLYTAEVVGSNPSVGTIKSVRRRSGRHPIPTTPLAADQEYKDSAADKTTMIDKHARSAVYVVISCLLHLEKVDALQC